MNKSQTQTLAVTMAIGFSVTFVYRAWQMDLVHSYRSHGPRRTEDFAAPPPEVTRSVAASNSVKLPSAEAAPQHVAPTAPQTLPVAAADHPVSAADIGPPSETALDLSFRIRRKFKRYDAYLRNLSDDDRSVDLEIVNPATQRVSQVSRNVPSHGQVVFGVDDGVDLESGDRVTLRAAPDRDVVLTVP